MGDTVPLAHFSTLLGHLVKEKEGSALNGRLMNKKTLQINPLISKEILGEYEAILTILCYHTRLNYENRARKNCKMYSVLDYSPLVFNKAISYLTYSNSTDDRIERNHAQKIPSGYLLNDPVMDNRVSIIVKPILGKKSMVISFRGTLSTKALSRSLTVGSKSLIDLFGKLFIGEDPTKFTAHSGYVNGLMNIFKTLYYKILYLGSIHKDIKSIYVTGHSLGGAYANIFGMALGQLTKRDSYTKKEDSANINTLPLKERESAMEKFKKKYEFFPSVHIVTFGATTTLSKYTRNVFNQLLMDGHMTFDRVTNRTRFPDVTMMASDPTPLGRPGFYHPGFMILNPEIKTQTRTGRTKHIRELRDELAGIKNSGFSKIIGNYNKLPDYPEFYSKFKDSSDLTAKEYSAIISKALYGTVRFGLGSGSKIIEIVKKLFGVTNDEIRRSEADEVIGIKKVNEKIKNEGGVEIPPQALEELKKDAAEVKAEYEAEGIEINANGLTKINSKASRRVTRRQKGGDVNTNINNKQTKKQTNKNIYKKQTVLEQPNQVVYSCSKITAPPLLPVPAFSALACHLGYMGVSYTGAVINAGSGLQGINTGIQQLNNLPHAIPAMFRDYLKEAELYEENGKWTYFSDQYPGYSIIVPQEIDQLIADLNL